MLKKSDFILLKKFLEKCDYTKEELKDINENFGKKNVTCLLNQIYAALKILSDNENEYLKIFNYLVNNFDLGCNILEVASGNYPILAEYIDQYQTKIGKGTITVVDPKLSVKELGNVKLVKKPFNYGDVVKPYDLIISQSPCLKLDDIAVSAIQNNKQFFISMCQCIYDRYPYLIDYYYVNQDYDPIFDQLLAEMRRLNGLNKINNLKIDSNSIFYDNNYKEIKCFSGKKLIKE